MADYGSSGGGGGGCCKCCTSFILTSGFAALFMWLSLRTSDPTCSIQDFYVPALNRSANSTSNTTLYFDLKLDNVNKDKGIHYDTLNLTFYYGSDQTHPIGGTDFPGFYQGHKKNTHRKLSLNTSGVPSEAVSKGTAVFRVDLATAVRFKILAWNTKRKRLVVWSTVDVNDSGKKVKKKGIKLSGAPELGCYRARGTLLVAFSVLIFLVTF